MSELQETAELIVNLQKLEQKIFNGILPQSMKDALAQAIRQVVELESIKHEAETNQKWAFLEWRQKANDATAKVTFLRSTLGTISGATRNATVADLVRWANKALREVDNV